MATVVQGQVRFFYPFYLFFLICWEGRRYGTRSVRAWVSTETVDTRIGTPQPIEGRGGFPFRWIGNLRVLPSEGGV